jgi:hypothetical protein
MKSITDAVFINFSRRDLSVGFDSAGVALTGAVIELITYNK